MPVIIQNVSKKYNHTKSNQKREFQPTHINSHPNEYTPLLRYYPLAVNLDRCLEAVMLELSNTVCVPNEIERSNLSVFNMITKVSK